MSIPYDRFIEAFLAKITEYDFVKMQPFERNSLCDGYMRRAVVAFKKNCLYDLNGSGDEFLREFTIDIPEADLEEIIDIISEGMVVQWLKPYTYAQENLQNVLNTKDFTTYSPSELLNRICSAYKDARKNFTQMIREYSYNHGNLTELHL